MSAADTVRVKARQRERGGASSSGGNIDIELERLWALGGAPVCHAIRLQLPTSDITHSSQHNDI